MCGIAGYFLMKDHAEQCSGLLADMGRVLQHRGPDDEGSFQDSFAGIAFRRLSILDLKTGSQPIFNEDGSLVLICNGEIFNYRELRADLLSQGHSFRSQSDVEVLVHLYEEHGPEMLGKLNGQFACAILDRRRRQLFLARDHVGIAPLYYAQWNGAFLFGSEIKAILEHPGFERGVDLTGLDQIFTFPGMVSPRTMFAGVSRIRPGHYLIVDENGARETEYWDLDYPRLDEPESGAPEREYVEGLTDRLCRSVRRRLQADVPVGLYLSGGLDSSMIAAFSGHVDPEIRRQAFAIGFRDEEANETPYQDLVAGRIKCRLHRVEFDWTQTAALMSRMIYHAECPVKETYNTCSLELSRAARNQGIKVVLSGEGADELFAGYVGYRFDQARAKRVNGSSTEAASERLMREALWGDGGIRYEQDYAAQREWRRTLYSRDLRDRFDSFDCLSQPLVRKDRLRGRHRVHQRSYLDFKLRMADHLLMDHGDSMALANSVEARYPFLDIELIDYARRIPPDLKLKGFTEKYILRKVGENILPPEITRRPKFGWYAPGSPEMLQQNVEWIRDALSPGAIRHQGYFDPELVESLTARYSQPGFKLNQPFESDWLIVIATFGLFKEAFRIPDCC